MKKPTVEQVRDVWDSMRSPTTRDVGDVLNSQGYKISYRTVARWKKNNWLGDGRTGKAGLSERQHTPGAVRELVRNALQTMDQANVDEANKIRAEGGLGEGITSKDDPEVTRILKRFMELMPVEKMTLTALHDLQERVRVSMNIILMEEAVRKAHILTTIPKDTGHFVHSFTEASKILSTPQPIEPLYEQPSNGSGARVIEGRVVEMSPLAQALRAAKEKALA